MATASMPRASRPKSKSQGLTLADSIAANMRTLARDFTSVLERRLAAHNVTVSMWFPLRILWEEDGITQNEIQQRLGLAQPTLVLALDRLEQRGLINRQRSETDRRKIHIYLTREGIDLEQHILHYADDIQSIATKNVTKQELDTLYRIFAKMRLALEQEQAIKKVDRNG